MMSVAVTPTDGASTRAYKFELLKDRRDRVIAESFEDLFHCSVNGLRRNDAVSAVKTSASIPAFEHILSHN